MSVNPCSSEFFGRQMLRIVDLPYITQIGSKSDYEQLSDMYTVYIESNLAKPLSGLVAIEISPRETAREVVNNFLFALQREDGIPGLAVFDKHYSKLDWDAALETQGIKEGSKLYIGYDRQPLFTPIHIAVIGVTTVIIAAVLLIASSVLFGTTGGDVPFDYGIVIDAGSTHTEVFLYQWSGSKQSGTGKVYQRAFCRNEEGIANEPDPDTIVACVKNVTRSLPSGVPASPILYLGATGGMRLLNMSNSKDAELIIMALKYALITTPVQVNSVGIIEGQVEGVSSWITTNFLKETLQQEKAIDTYGALDLGGASTQYAYALKSGSGNNSSAAILRLYGHQYSVVSESFLCFGLSKSMDRIKALELMAVRSASIIDPCLPKNYSKHINAKEFLESPCVHNGYFSRWLREHPNENETINVLGSGDYKKCKELVKKLIDEQNCKELGFSECLHKADIAEQDGKYMAFSSFYYIVAYFHGSGSLDKFISNTKEFCNLSWEEVEERSHSKSELSHLVTYCFGAVYTAELLTSNYGFNSTTWKNISFKKQIKDADVGWSLGYMINATNAIPEELPSPPVISLSVFIPLVVLSVLMIFTALLLIHKNIKHLCLKKHERLTEF